MPGKTIRLYLTSGRPSGILTAEIINWTGKMVVAPRPKLAELAAREEVHRTGVYCLTGPDPDAPSRDRVYVGEGDNVFARLRSHEQDESKDFWTRAAVVISKDANLTKAHVRYLESRMIAQAHEAGRAEVANGTAPPTPALPEPDVADMEFFLEQVQMVLPVLGFTFLQPRPRPRGEGGREEGPVFYDNDVGAEARAVEVEDEFVVLAGSTARKQETASWQSYRSLRAQLIEEGKLVEGEAPDYYVFAEDVPFSSPSAAAAVIAGCNRSGPRHWRVEGSGKTYREWREEKMQRAAPQESIEAD